ncbi:hypothetical protein J2Z65_001142 [Paenibacillus aceris]|uniref:Uncharacterized protein n=1 Tax=Paenibacillus aceris TaxID=869555 RepID=A0ABS4HVC9_9BACL|nr:hypothetical protein [Paenibacillus aceris]
MVEKMCEFISHVFFCCKDDKKELFCFVVRPLIRLYCGQKEKTNEKALEKHAET